MSTQPSEAIWYSFRGKPYKGNAPVWFEVSEFKWAQQLEDDYPKYKQAIDRYLAEKGLSFQPYFNEGLVSRFKSWQISVFYFWRLRSHNNLKRIPELDALFHSIPGFLSASISLLEGDSEIKEHAGDTNAIIRCHLGLQIPGSLPECGFEVAGEQRSWEEGKLLLFCDAQKHRAFNHTKENRYVLLIDVLRPEYLSRKGNVNANVLSSLWLQKFKSLKNAPGWIRGGVRVCLKAWAWIWVPIQRTVHF